MPPKAASRGEYIETETGNKISRRASILGPKHIILAGKCVIQHDVIVHGDLVKPTSSSSTTTKPSSKSSTTSTNEPTTAAKPPDSVSVHIGRYVFISPHCTLHPPSRLQTLPPSTTNPHPTPTLTYYPLRIGDHVCIGPHTHIRAAQVGSHVRIGAHCTIGNLVIIRDNVRVEDGTVLPAHSVWASGVVVAGRPGRVVGEIGDGWAGAEGAGGSVAESRRRWEGVGNEKGNREGGKGR